MSNSVSPSAQMVLDFLNGELSVSQVEFLCDTAKAEAHHARSDTYLATLTQGLTVGIVIAMDFPTYLKAIILANLKGIGPSVWIEVGNALTGKQDWPVAK